MDNFWQDLRYSIRSLARDKSFSAIAILVLAVGIGANTAIFSALDAVILKMLPVKNPKQLVFVNAYMRGEREDGYSLRTFQELQGRSESYSGMFAFDTTRLSVNVEGQSDFIWGQSISGSFCGVLGVNPILGRPLTPDDDQPAKPPLALISYDYWKRRFALDPAVLEKKIVVKGIVFSVAGVMPKGFRGIEPGDSPDLWTPMVYWEQLRLNDHLTVAIMARLKPGVTAEQAAAETGLIDHQLAVQAAGAKLTPEFERNLATRKIELKAGGKGLNDLPDALPQSLLILMAGVGFVLLIACANVANLLLARSAGRRKEIAVRLAIGAQRFRLIQQLFSESLLLALAGGVLGVLFAYWGSDSLSRFLAGGSDALPLDTQPDLRALGFTLAVSVLTAVLFGLAPALRATRLDLFVALKNDVGGGTSLSRQRLRNLLVAGQIALSTLLLVSSGLLLRSLVGLVRVDPGFRQDNVLLVSVYPTLSGYQGDRELNLYSSLQEHISAAPGVLSSSTSRFSLLSGGRWRREISIPGIGNKTSEKPQAICNPVAPRFFETMGIPAVLGRDFTPADGKGAPKVAIVSESFARKYFANDNPVGQQFQFAAPAGQQGELAEIVGVVRDVRSLRLRQPDHLPAVYTPIAQAPADILGQVTIEVRTAENPAAISSAVRSAMQTVDRNLPPVGVRTQTQQTEESVSSERSLTIISSLFGILALLLACIGLYGVVAYSVAQRTREIGIRMALGAAPSSVMKLVLGQGFHAVWIGLAAGIASALGLTRLLASFLYGIAPTDGATFLGVTVILAAAAVAAIYVPARRATRVDPLVALRYE